MAVSIDTVYQKVLALANKEQRGYITPQEFNLFADMAQKEIFEQYFYDKNQWARQHGSEFGYSDMLSNLDEKIGMFEDITSSNNITLLNQYGDANLSKDLPDLYRLGQVRVKYPANARYVVAELVSAKEFRLIQQSPLTKQSVKRPVYIRYHKGYDRIKIYPNPTNDDGSAIRGGTTDNVSVDHVFKPSKPKWGYVMVYEKALYDADRSTNFDLHPSEESELVYKVLKYAGISLQKQDIMQAGVGMEQAQAAQEKK
tara:strand:- start:1806 stop:2573 length:768 start_codon:yes stop_codon:yes gene_type:complete